MRALVCLLALVPGPALAVGLECTFTTICSPLTDCQTHPGVPFRFDVVSGAFTFFAEDRPVFGTRLTHLTPPAYGAIFQTSPDSTILLTVTGTGDAVMTQQDLTSGGGVRSISYFGICEPGA
ncbi:hypothetical protein [Jannaschia sp. CCS1]|uniref:hypothetical protein n=1 Tax=Jannaschia sp. (strain CCS1) TaxID=290400 RepID=UPI000053D959|nr:hypothetical protein [Jannaschia sp. CCS1]ABD55078.1 hypothetical protein Jann_2161 [Jannaschia sp. CCS1]